METRGWVLISFFIAAHALFYLLYSEDKDPYLKELWELKSWHGGGGVYFVYSIKLYAHCNFIASQYPGYYLFQKWGSKISNNSSSIAPLKNPFL